MSPRREDRGPRRLGPSLDAVAGQLGLGASAAQSGLFGRWEEIAGPMVAAHVAPVRLEAGTLVVAVDHPAWATQVRALGDQLLDRVAEVTGGPRPDRLEVRVRPPNRGAGGPPMGRGGPPAR